MKNFILASTSPRRIEILKNLNMKFEIIPSSFEEVITQKSPYELVCEFAKAKAMDVAAKAPKNRIVIAADTIVFKDDEILGKPKSAADAFAMLRKLSNNSHSVLTGICIVDTDTKEVLIDYEETVVFFKDLSDEEINNYIYSKEPLDKAGAYGIQGIGSMFVKKIDGCYFNVVGLPVFKLNVLLGKMGVNLLVKVKGE
jgi:septum formation protein